MRDKSQKTEEGSRLMPSVLCSVFSEETVLVAVRLASRRMWIVLVCLVGAMAVLPLALLLAPWFDAAPTPIEVKLDAPAKAKIDACWDAALRECVPLVAAAGTKKAHDWIGELPPRPVYHLSLVFRSQVEDARLQRITLLNMRYANQAIYQRSADNTDVWFSLQDGTMQRRDDAFSLNIQPGGRLILAEPISNNVVSFAQRTMLIWLMLAGFVVCGVALVAPWFGACSFARPFLAASGHSGVGLLCLAAVVATAIQLVFVAHAQVQYGTGDSTIYLLKAVKLLEHRTFDSDGYEFELNRLPGYPLILAFAIALVGYNLSHVVLVQSVLCGASILAFALAVRRWIHPVLGAVGIVIATLSPPQVWASRNILSDGPFAWCTLLALAAFFTHAGARGASRWIWLGAFVSLATYASFIRPNAVIVFAALLPVYLPQAMQIVRQHAHLRARLRALVRFTLPYAAAMLIFVVAYGGWALRNYVSRGYFGTTDMGQLSIVQGALSAGWFEARSLLDQDEYRAYVKDHYRHEYFYMVWILRTHLFDAIEQDLQVTPSQQIALLNEHMHEIAAGSAARAPWQMRLVGPLRSVLWAIAWPQGTSYTRDAFRLDYALPSNYTDIDAIRTEMAPLSSRLVYETQQQNSIFALFAGYTRAYTGWYLALSVVALISGVYVAWRGYSFLSAPLIVFLANLAVVGVLGNILARYVQVLDVLLVFQSVIAGSLLLSVSSRQEMLRSAIQNRKSTSAHG